MLLKRDDWYNITKAVAHIKALQSSWRRQNYLLSHQADQSKDASPQLPKRRQMLCTNDAITNDHARSIRGSVEPVLRTIINAECTLEAFTCLWWLASCSVYTVDIRVIALDSVQLQP
jgi:hypothetical protein